MQPKRITSVVLLVHPLFSFISDWEEAKRGTFANSKFLLGLWGKQLAEAARNPNELVVIVKPEAPEVFPWQGRREWSGFSLERLERLMAFARNALGQRLIEVEGKIHPEVLRREVSEKGFVLEKNAMGKAFGEYWGEQWCVEKQAKELEKALGIKVWLEPKFSVKPSVRYAPMRKYLTAERPSARRRFRAKRQLKP